MTVIILSLASVIIINIIITLAIIVQYFLCFITIIYYCNIHLFKKSTMLFWQPTSFQK